MFYIVLCYIDCVSCQGCKGSKNLLQNAGFSRWMGPSDPEVAWSITTQLHLLAFLAGRLVERRGLYQPIGKPLFAGENYGLKSTHCFNLPIVPSPFSPENDQQFARCSRRVGTRGFPLRPSHLYSEEEELQRQQAPGAPKFSSHRGGMGPTQCHHQYEWGTMDCKKLLGWMVNLTRMLGPNARVTILKFEVHEIGCAPSMGWRISLWPWGFRPFIEFPIQPLSTLQKTWPTG